MSRRSSIVTGVALLALLVPATVEAYPAPGRTSRVSTSSTGVQSDQWSGVSSITPDGRTVAFVSWGKTLVQGDTNEQSDIFVHDRRSGSTERVSLTTGEGQADDWSWAPSISANGRWVAFESNASNLVPGDTNGAVDAYLRDRSTGTTQRISVAMDGSDPNHHSGGPVLSSDARFVVFSSVASNLVPGDTNGKTDVFVRDLTTGVIERVSVSSEESQASENSYRSDVTSDGRFVVFTSEADDLVPGDDNGASDVFLRDRVNGTTELISVGLGGTAGDGAALAPDITDDGRWIAFHSRAGNLVPRDTNGLDDVFVRDRLEARTERVSLTSSGVQTGGYAHYPTISDDGRFVSFTSGANTLAPGDATFYADAFVHDRLLGTTELVSRSSEGNGGNHESSSPSLSADGRFVTFTSRASNLVEGDTNASPYSADVFVRDRGPATGVGGLTVERQGGALHVSGWATFGGRVLAAATDPADDALGPADQTGAEIVSADLVHRVEEESLLARIRLEAIPTLRPPKAQCPLPFGQECPEPPEGLTGRPAGLVGMRFSVGGTAYQARAIPASATASGASAFELLRCTTVCERAETLSGSFGTSGSEARIRIPLDALAGNGLGAVTGIEAITALGESGLPAEGVLDSLTLGTGAVVDPTVSVSIARALDPPGEETATPVVDGSFALTADIPAAGAYRAEAMACLADRCGQVSVPFTI